MAACCSTSRSHLSSFFPLSLFLFSGLCTILLHCTHAAYFIYIIYYISFDFLVLMFNVSLVITNVSSILTRCCCNMANSFSSSHLLTTTEMQNTKKEYKKVQLFINRKFNHELSFYRFRASVTFRYKDTQKNKNKHKRQQQC